MKIPVVEQHDSSDCGVACAVSICAYYGKEVTISKLREVMGTDAYGTSIAGLIKGLESVGFRAKSLYISRESFANDTFTLPAIARLVRSDGTAHYVSVYQIRKGIVTYMDPDQPVVQRKTIEEFNVDFDGGLIMMVPTNEFLKGKENTHSLRLVFSRIIKAHTGLFILAIVFSVIMTIFGIVSAMFNKVLVDEIIPYQQEHQLLLFGIVLVAIGVTQVAVSAFRQHVIIYLSQKIDIPLMMGYFSHIFKLPMRFFESRRTGDIVTRFQDAGTVKNVLTNTALTAVIDTQMVIIVGVILASQSLNLFVVILVMAILSGVLMYSFKSPYRTLNRKEMEQNAKLNSQVIESLNNVGTVKTNVSEQYVLDEIETEFVRTLRVEYRKGVLNNVQSSLSSAITNLGNLALIIYGGYLVIKGNMSLGTLFAFTSLTGYFIDPIGRLVGMQLSIQEAEISIARLTEIYDVEEEDDAQAGKEVLNEPIEEVDLTNVSFAYGTRPPVLHDVSIHIGKGERVAIVGRSGCGKTTLSKLILKFYDPTEGSVKINGRDVREIDSFSLRNRIGCVPQDVRTFSGSIRKNLLLGRDATKDELDNACRLSGCTEFIKRLPQGYDTFLDETGGGLSGGERQRLILARALVRNPDFLIMDEATSNMDYVTEKATFNLMFKELTGVPMLIIAHRLSTIRNCNRIYMMIDGRVVETGTHQELLDLKGEYYNLWSSQMGDDESGQGETAPEDGGMPDEQDAVPAQSAVDPFSSQESYDTKEEFKYD